MKIIIKAAVLFLLASYVVKAQSAGISITAGSGSISSDSPYYSGFTTSVSVGIGKIYDAVSPRLSLYYVGDFNSLLPGSDRAHYPHIAGLALKGVYSLHIQGDLFYEQCLGFFAGYDNVFSNSDGWGPGFVISGLGGADFRGSSSAGFRIGIGGEYALTVYNRYIRYLGLYFQAQYIFSY